MQSRLESFIEQVLSTLFGLFVAILGQLLIFPRYDIEVRFVENLEIAGFFTVLSIIRGTDSADFSTC